MFCFGTEIGTENRGFSLVSNTEILVQHDNTSMNNVGFSPDFSWT